MDAFKLLMGLAVITAISAAVGLIDLGQLGLGGLQESLNSVLSDIQAAIDYIQSELGTDVQQLLDKQNN